MDMQNRRMEGEKSLSQKLEMFDSGFDAQDLKDFETLLDTSPKKSRLWIFFKYLGLLLAVGAAVLLFLREDSTSFGDAERTSEKIGNYESDNTPAIKENFEGHIGQGKVDKAPEYNITSKEKESVDRLVDNDSSKSKMDGDYSNQSSSEPKIQRNEYNERSISRDGAFTSKDISKVSTGFSYFDSIDNLGANQAQNEAVSEIEEVSKGNSSLSISSETSNLFFENLPLKNYLLESRKRKFEPLLLEVPPIEIVSKENKRISFGIQYNTGKTHAGAHETPFVSNFPTRIEGGKSFGYGFFGQVNLDKRHAIRPSFTYSKNTHLHFVDSLRFFTGITSINMELHSHELKFGLDYSFNFLPNVDVIDLKAGVGVAYHSIVSLESNNYYTEIREQVKEANELDLSPLSYKLFAGLDVHIYKNIVAGIEPYIIYQKRTAKYTPSSFVADQGDHNLISGINLTLRF